MVVDHVLRQPESDVPVQLRRDLIRWRDGEEGESKKKKVRSCSKDGNVEDVASTISFELIKRAHKQLEKTPLGIIPNSHSVSEVKSPHHVVVYTALYILYLMQKPVRYISMIW